MRIAYIAAGAGGLYCGACARDLALLRALRAAGHEVLVVPLYTPLRADAPVGLPMSPLFFGGISTYLRQASKWFGYLPGVGRKLLDHPGLLRLVSRRAIQTDPRALGPLTVSMLSGAAGPQAREAQRLADFLAQDFRPDVVHITNSLLIALAPILRERLTGSSTGGAGGGGEAYSGGGRALIFCTLQGEESFLAALPEAYRQQAVAWCRQHAAAVDGFIACAQERVAPLAELLRVAPERISVVLSGLDAAPYQSDREPIPPGEPRNVTAIPQTEDQSAEITIGYLSPIRRVKGLDVLLEAVHRLVAEDAGGDGEAGRKGRRIRLAIAGQILEPDYEKELRQTIRRYGLEKIVTWRGELSLAEKVTFLHGCDVFVLPTRQAESRAMAVMEALAAGVPVIASGLGILPELLTDTGGGITVPPEDPAGLAAALTAWRDHPAQAAAIGRQGAAALATRYTPPRMAAATLAVYQQVWQRVLASGPQSR